MDDEFDLRDYGPDALDADADVSWVTFPGQSDIIEPPFLRPDGVAMGAWSGDADPYGRLDAVRISRGGADTMRTDILAFVGAEMGLPERADCAFIDMAPERPGFVTDLLEGADRADLAWHPRAALWEVKLNEETSPFLRRMAEQHGMRESDGLAAVLDQETGSAPAFH